MTHKTHKIIKVLRIFLYGSSEEKNPQTNPLGAFKVRDEISLYDITRQTTQIKRHIEARSCNQCCGGRAMSIAQLVYMFLSAGIRHAMDMHHIVICDMLHSTIFLHIVTHGTIFEKKKY
jgi:hypothetical protein